MRFFTPILIGFFLLSCEHTTPLQTHLLKGYWEIEKVSSHGKTFLPKGAAPLVDYYFLKDKQQGYRKKLAPSFGPYQTSDQQFGFKIEHNNGEYYLHFSKALEPWKEKIISLDATHLVLEHQDKEYHYIRHEKIKWNE